MGIITSFNAPFFGLDSQVFGDATTSILMLIIASMLADIDTKNLFDFLTIYRKKGLKEVPKGYNLFLSEKNADSAKISC